MSADIHVRRTGRTGQSSARAAVAMNVLSAGRMAPPATVRSLAARHALLASLSGDAFRRLHAGVERVHLPRGQILSTPGVLMPYAYVPRRGVAALVAMTAANASKSRWRA